MGGFVDSVVNTVSDAVSGLTPQTGGGGGGGGFFGGFFDSIGSAITGAAKDIGAVVSGVEKAGEKVVGTVSNTVENIAKNPLPVIETVGLISAGVDPSTAGALVNAANGGSPKQIAASYVGSELANETVGPGNNVTTAAERGAIAGGTSAALTGKNIAQGALGGAGTAGISAGLQAGYKATLPNETDYSLTSPTQAPGTGINAAKAGNPFTDQYSPTIYEDGFGGVKANANTDATSYDIAAPGDTTSGVQANVNTNATTAPTLSGIDKTLADYVAKDIVRQASGSSNATNPATPAVSAVTTGSAGSQQSPNAVTPDAADPGGLGAKEGKIGGKYPWGNPEGTTALKEEGQVI